MLLKDPRVLLSRRYWSPQCVYWRAGPAACLLTGTQTLQNSLLRDAQQTCVLPADQDAAALHMPASDSQRR